MFPCRATAASHLGSGNLPATRVRSRESATTSLENALEAQVGDEIAALVLDCERTLHAFERRLGILVTEIRSPLVIRLGGRGILRPAAPFLGERPHPLQSAGMVLRSRLLEQRAG